MGKMNLTDAERKRRSELAKQLHQRRDPVTGRPLLGGPQPGSGRPRKRRATEILNEKVEDNAEAIWDRLFNLMMHGKEMSSLVAIRQMMDIANREVDIQMAEDKSLENTSTEELVELVASRMARLAESGLIPFDAESTAEDFEPEELSAGDQGSNDQDREEDEPEGSAEAGRANSNLGASPFSRRSSE